MTRKWDFISPPWPHGKRKRKSFKWITRELQRLQTETRETLIQLSHLNREMDRVLGIDRDTSASEDTLPAEEDNYIAPQNLL